MDLKVGDIVEFKKYEDMDYYEASALTKEKFSKHAKVKEVYPSGCFFVEENPYCYSTGSVARVISDADDINNLNVGDEVLAKVTVKGIFADGIRISSQIKTSDVVKILKRKEPERFIVKEDYYGMYVNGSGVLITDKRHAKIYNSRNEANDEAANMHLNAWDVIPYGD